MVKFRIFRNDGKMSLLFWGDNNNVYSTSSLGGYLHLQGDIMEVYNHYKECDMFIVENL